MRQVSAYCAVIGCLPKFRHKKTGLGLGFHIKSDCSLRLDDGVVILGNKYHTPD